VKIAFFSPLPPAKSGIADYSAVLLDHLKRFAEVEAFGEKPAVFDPSKYEAIVYQLGNNPYHAFVYEMAMEHPGIVVLHEANLHHLIAEMTIRRGDWDAYVREVEINAGAEARDFAQHQVRALKAGPDYGIPMLKPVLGRSRGAIVHSAAVESELRALGYQGPVAKIPHGAWIVDADRMAYRGGLGIGERTPLIGIFGFLKPYKRIAESLRAFARLVRVAPEARLILVGEAHEELPLHAMIAALGLEAHARHIGFTPIEDFNGYLGSCDIVLNLRYPTVGESSGTLLRALGMGKAVVVSDVGSFREYPDEICLKAPVDSSEEDMIFEYLNLLVSRPDVAQSLGARAREWVDRECNWHHVAERYAWFLQGKQWPEKQAETAPLPEPVEVPIDYVASWTPPQDGAREYLHTHDSRFEKTLAMTPPGTAEDRILEMGAYMQITPALKFKLGYGEVRGCYYGPAGQTDHKTAHSDSGETFHCDVDLFNAESDRFPYPDGHFTTVLCCELLEHLPTDPMFMMSEINRILKPGGYLLLTTPNIASLRSIAAVLQGFHPQLFSTYIRPNEEGDARHHREYTCLEIKQLLENSGFEIARLETGPFHDEPRPEYAWVEHLLERYILSKDLRGDGIYVLGRKTGPVRERYPAWLYS
jgi:glycosyltransferase involved in cell wall biosynthesis/SAM-dependent methyltransferase